MSFYLYVDSSDGLVCGLLHRDRENFEWCDFREFEGVKASMILHGQIHEILGSNQTSLDQVSGLIISSGPGSYTGIRLAEGLAQIFEWRNYPVYSFYHFQVPQMCHYQTGSWIARAFKGENFVYSWNGKESTIDLVGDEEFNFDLQVKPVFIHRENEKQVFSSSYTTFSLIKDRPYDIFSPLIDSKIREKPYYYRPIDKEYRRSNIIKK